jgi:hypothetical protein
VGHASFFVRTLFPHITPIATDYDFVNLYLAQYYLIPDAPCLVLDCDQPLPFRDQSLAAVCCMDGLHYVRSKRALLAEFDRCIDKSGIWLFSHLHNARAKNPTPGFPLSAADYRSLFELLPSRFLVEADVLRRFQQDDVVDLSGVEPEAACTAPVLSVVAGHRYDLWRRHEGLAELMVRAKAHLAVNPIYRCSAQGEKLTLRMTWPSEKLQKECEATKQALPERCTIPAYYLEDQAAVERLVRSFILVPLPASYGA